MEAITPLLDLKALPVWVLVIIALSWCISKYGKSITTFFKTLFNHSSNYLVTSLQQEVKALKTQIQELEDENEKLHTELSKLREEHAHFKGVIEGFTALLNDKGITLPHALQKKI